MVDTLIESQSNVELLLQFFDIFLKMKGLTTSEAFQEFDTNKDGFISPKEFRRAMEAQKMYSKSVHSLSLPIEGFIDTLALSLSVR